MSLTSINLYELKQKRTKSYRYDLENCRLTCPLACYNAIQLLLNLHEEPTEKFGILSLNAKHKILGLHIIAAGTMNDVLINPREVYKPALLNNAYAIIAFHNHPSGDPTPSREDIEMTKRLKEAGKMIGVELIDHLVVGEEGYVSLREKGLLEH